MDAEQWGAIYQAISPKACLRYKYFKEKMRRKHHQTLKDLGKLGSSVANEDSSGDNVRLPYSNDSNTAHGHSSACIRLSTIGVLDKNLAVYYAIAEGTLLTLNHCRARSFHQILCNPPIRRFSTIEMR